MLGDPGGFQECSFPRLFVPPGTARFAGDAPPQNAKGPVTLSEVERPACLQRAPHVVARQIGGEAVLVPVSAGVADLEAIYTLNETGLFVWEHLDGDTPAEGLAEALEASFAVPRAEAERDVRALLEEMKQEGLVVAKQQSGVEHADG